MGRTGEKDVAASVVPEYAQPWDREVERRVVRKIDLALIPLMWFGYGLVYYDKAILGGAAVFGMTTDLQLRVVTDPTTTPPTVSTWRLSWATSIFYFGMLAGVGPLTYLFQRFHLGRTIGLMVIAWGATAMSTAGVTSYQGLWAQRFFLGFTESIMPTAFMVIVSGYYTQAEQTWRQCLWYSATGGWTVIGAGINYGFASINGGDLHRWQYLYLMAGGLTVVYGVVFLFFPDSPAQAWWFNEEEKRVAIERLRMGQLGVRCQTIKWPQIKESFLDVKVWMIAIMMGAAYSVNGAVSGFGPLIVSTFGWTAMESLLWQMPLGGVCFVTILLAGYLSLKIPNIRLIMLILFCLPVIAGCAMIWKSTWYHHAATPIAGYTIIGFFAPVTSLTVSMGMANVAGNTKKSYMAAATFVMYCVGNIAGPFFIKSETVGRHYPRLWEGIIGCYALVIALAAGLYLMLRAENKKRDAMRLDEKEAERVAFNDLTDKQNKHFRYVFAFRRAASRLLTARSPVVASAVPRTYTSLAASAPRISRRAPVFLLQQRWASTEPENKDVPASELPSTPEAEVAQATEAVDPQVSSGANSEVVNDAAESVSTPVAEAANPAEATPGTAEQDAAAPQQTQATGQQMFGPKTTLYIGNLFFDVTEPDLVKELARFGTISQIRIVRDGRGLSKGFGYVDFADQKSADEAMNALNMQLYEGRRLTVQYAARRSSDADLRSPTSRPRNPPSPTLFIGNMSFEMSDRDLSNLFRGIHGITDVRIAVDKRTGQPRGFAHADFVDVKSATEAIKALSAKEIYGRKLRLDYSYSPSTAVKNRPRNTPDTPESQETPEA